MALNVHSVTSSVRCAIEKLRKMSTYNKYVEKESKKVTKELIKIQ